MATVEKTIQEFRANVEPYLVEWDGLDIRLMAAIRNEKPVLVLARIRAVRRGNVPAPAYIPRVEGLAFEHVVEDAKSLDRLVAEASEGRLTVNGRTYFLNEGGDAPRSASSSIYSRYLGLEGTAVTLEFNGGGASNSRPKDLERLLLSADPPYADPRDMLGSFFGPEHENEDWSTRVLFTLSPGIRVAGVKVDDGSVVAEIRGCDKARAREVRASFVAWARDGTKRRWQIPLEGAEADGGAGVRWLHRVPDDVTHGQVWILDHGLILGHADFSLQARAGVDSGEAILAQLSGDPEFLKKGLERVEHHSDRLESWVHMLFHCLGWRSFHAGGRSLGWDTADVVAHAPGDRPVALIECTTSTPTQGNKLAKLHARAKKLEKETSRQIIPVLTTNRNAEELSSADRDSAAKDGIVLLAMEDLERLAEMAYEPEGADVLEYLSSRILLLPRGGALSTFGMVGGRYL